MSEISRWNVPTTIRQHIDPIVVTSIFRIAQQVAEVLHRHKRSEEERIKHDLLLDERSQCLRSGEFTVRHLIDQLLATKLRRLSRQRCVVCRQSHTRGLFELRNELRCIRCVG